jgi:hypothetical protein
MAEENNTGSTTEIAETDAPAKVPAPNKQRTPRRPKATAGATLATSLAKLPRGRTKRGEQAGNAKPTPVEMQVSGKSTAKDVIKDTGRNRTSKHTEQTVATPVSAIDEMADLIQLEEENKSLRRNLADKLRAENADLRKRLGLD